VKSWRLSFFSQPPRRQRPDRVFAPHTRRIIQNKCAADDSSPGADSRISIKGYIVHHPNPSTNPSTFQQNPKLARSSRRVPPGPIPPPSERTAPIPVATATKKRKMRFFSRLSL